MKNTSSKTRCSRSAEILFLAYLLLVAAAALLLNLSSVGSNAQNMSGLLFIGGYVVFMLATFFHLWDFFNGKAPLRDQWLRTGGIFLTLIGWVIAEAGWIHDDAGIIYFVVLLPLAGLSVLSLVLCTLRSLVLASKQKGLAIK